MKVVTENFIHPRNLVAAIDDFCVTSDSSRVAAPKCGGAVQTLSKLGFEESKLISSYLSFACLLRGLVSDPAPSPVLFGKIGSNE